MLDCAGAPQKYCVKASCGVNDLELSVTAGGDGVQAPTVWSSEGASAVVT